MHLNTLLITFFINNEHEHIIYELINEKETCISLATYYVLRMSNALPMMDQAFTNALLLLNVIVVTCYWFTHV